MSNISKEIKRIEPLYPDVLGAITGGARISMDKLQCALGIFIAFYLWRDPHTEKLITEVPDVAARVHSVLHYDGLPIDAQSVVDGVLAHEGRTVTEGATR